MVSKEMMHNISAPRWYVNFSDHFPEWDVRRNLHMHWLQENNQSQSFFWSSDIKRLRKHAVAPGNGSVFSKASYRHQLSSIKFVTAVTRVVNVREWLATFAIIRLLPSPCASLWSSAPPFRQAGWRARKSRSSVWCEEQQHTSNSKTQKKRADGRLSMFCICWNCWNTHLRLSSWKRRAQVRVVRTVWDARGDEAREVSRLWSG